MPHHSLVLTDRNAGAPDGVRHYHRWAARCRCGAWTGLHQRTRREAGDEYRQHVRSAENQVRAARGGRRRRRSPLLPRPVTPRDQLPDALR